MARYGQAFKDRAVARLLPPESTPVKTVSQEMPMRSGDCVAYRSSHPPHCANCVRTKRPVSRTRIAEMTKDRVAPGRYRPGAPTDPFVRALAHTVPLIMDSLRVEESIGLCEREQVGNCGEWHRISPRSSSGGCCGD